MTSRSCGPHVLDLCLSNCYGHFCRFANPTALNAAAGWLFVNEPNDVQHLCSTNVRNYQRRYLPGVKRIEGVKTISVPWAWYLLALSSSAVKLKVAESYQWSTADIYKWVTHEKGILGSQVWPQIPIGLRSAKCAMVQASSF